MRLIDADAMREEWLENGQNEYVYDTNAVLDSIDEQPTIEAEPVRHGYWIKVGTSCGIDILECSECHARHPRKGDNYCRDCGAKMDGKEKEE